MASQVVGILLFFIRLNIKPLRQIFYSKVPEIMPYPI